MRHRLRRYFVHFTRFALTAALAISPSSVFAQATLNGQVELARLVDLAAQRLGVRMSYDESALKGRITLRQDKPISDAELWHLTNRVLAEQGLTTVRAGDDDTIAVVKLAAAATTARIERVDDVNAAVAELANSFDRANAGLPAPTNSWSPGFRRILVPLRRASPKEVVSLVQLVVSKSGGAVAESEQAGLLLIADLVPHLEAALRIVGQLDGPEGGTSIRQVVAKNSDATKLAALAKQLAEKRKAVGGRELRGEVIASPGDSSTVTVIAPAAVMEQWEALISSCDQRESAERRTYSTGSFGLQEVSSLIEQLVRGGSTGPAGAGPDDRWRLVLDELTSTLIITATTRQHELIEELLAHLASVPAEARRPVRTFKLCNRTAREVQQVVEDLLRTGILEAQAAGDGATTPSSLPGGAFPSGPQTFQRSALGKGAPEATHPPPSLDGTSAADRHGVRGTRLGVGATARNSPSLTITSDEATNTLIAVGEPRLLAQLEKLLPTLDVRQPQVMLEAILVSLNDSQSLNFGMELEHLRVSGDTMIRLSSLFGLSAGVGGGTRNVGDGAGFTGTVLNPGDFAVVVRALQSVNRGRSVSSPRILVNNNQQATFNSVLQQPFATTNASTTVATTSFGGTQDAGTTISVRPQIAEGDHLVLTYSVSLSSFVGAASSANLPPPRQQNSVQSVATIPDGHTVVVGGLELNTEGSDVSQVPGIGSIPIVGELFKNRGKSSGRQRFYVFLRASVLRQPNLEGLKHLSEIDAREAALDDQWPRVVPRVIR